MQIPQHGNHNPGVTVPRRNVHNQSPLYCAQFADAGQPRQSAGYQGRPQDDSGGADSAESGCSGVDPHGPGLIAESGFAVDEPDNQYR